MDHEPSAHRDRWWICGLLFVATALSFLDRQVLAAMSKLITQNLRMSDPDYAQVNNAFLASYAVMFLLGGRMMDWLGTRRGLALSVGLWSIASGLHALVQNAFQLGVCRFILGVGEGGCIPGAAKGIAQTFPPAQRALAMGIAIGGVSLGILIAAPMAVWLVPLVNWRGVFVATAIVGATWVVFWWFLARGLGPASEVAPKVSSDETDTARPTPLVGLLARGDVWAFALMRFIFDPVFYFYMFWIPKYLDAERKLSFQQLGVTWVPFFALGVSNIAGGWVSDRLIQRGMPAPRARRLIMGLAALLTIASSFTVMVHSVAGALTMMSLLMLAHGFWITNYVTTVAERYPRCDVGTVTGFAGAAGAVGGIIANTTVGWMIARFSYAPAWVASGIMYPLAFVVMMAMIRSQSETLKEQNEFTQLNSDVRR